MNEVVRPGVGRACGKVILLGEHAVVYGVPALAVGIDRGANARATPTTGPCRLKVPGWAIDVAEGDGSDLGRAFTALLEATRAATRGFPAGCAPANGNGASHALTNGLAHGHAVHANGAASVSAGPSALPPVVVEAHADLPPGGGLGCSAALGVAVARALDTHASAAQIAERAMAWERVFHGNPSGIDAAVSASGGCVLFEKGRGIEPVRLRSSLLLCIGHTGCGSSTKTMVEAVARRKARSPAIVDKSFEAIRALVRNARLALEAGDRTGLGRLMDLNQMLLGGLFVSTPEIERLCELARNHGAFGAKLTGAGGGGSVVALVPSSSVADAVLEAWKDAGFHGFSTRVAGLDVAPEAMSEAAP